MQKVLLAIIAASIVTIGLTVNYSTAHHEPADKTAGVANSIEEVGSDDVVLLEETMRVSTTADLILSTTAECSILTALHTTGGPPPAPTAENPNPGPATETDGAFGQVELWITVDGNRVPVESAPRTGAAGTDDGEVVFCNRAYQRTVKDNEDLRDGLDSEDDFIRTRTANGFNWMAFNAGEDTSYDTLPPNNIVEVKLHGRFTRQTNDGSANCASRQADTALAPYGETCADAFVGKRSLIVEAVHASTHEQTTPAGTGG